VPPVVSCRHWRGYKPGKCGIQDFTGVISCWQSAVRRQRNWRFETPVLAAEVDLLFVCPSCCSISVPPSWSDGKTRPKRSEHSRNLFAVAVWLEETPFFIHEQLGKATAVTPPRMPRSRLTPSDDARQGFAPSVIPQGELRSLQCQTRRTSLSTIVASPRP